MQMSVWMSDCDSALSMHIRNTHKNAFVTVETLINADVMNIKVAS